MIRYVSAFLVSLFLITPAIASTTYATIRNLSPNFISLVRDNGTTITVAPYGTNFGVPFNTRSYVSNYVNVAGMNRFECQWYIHSSMVETLDSLVYNPENLRYGLSPCAKVAR